MDSLLQEITMLPGVLGCFVYSGEQQIAGSKMPPIFKENSIKTIGSLLARTIQMGNIAQLNFSAIEFKFNESLLIVNPMAKGALLVIICEPRVNKSLIAMTMGMLTADIETAMAKNLVAPVPQQAVTTTHPAPSTHQSPPAPAQAPAREADIDAHLASILEQIKEALAMAIGPIAGPVMKESIELWAQQGTTSPKNLPTLAVLLCKEINDQELEKEFMADFTKIVS
ncbi:MAG: hypothetical protein KJ804_21175 [Proteobacteria bacterium]|nr:hypothetical protein [Pseudomonadota bacterium]MBU1060823.1 hypothetical protein [Pseudomonadota bacterium]